MAREISFLKTTGWPGYAVPAPSACVFAVFLLVVEHFWDSISTGVCESDSANGPLRRAAPFGPLHELHEVGRNRMTQSRTRIAIAGGGVPGLVTAALLRRQGIDARIFGQTPEFGVVGAGIQLSPNGVRVLHRLGLEAVLARTGVRVLARTGVRAQAIETRRWPS